MVHFQTDVGTIPLAPPPAAPPGRCRALGRGIFKHLFENGPYLAHPIFKIAIGLVFQNFII